MTLPLPILDDRNFDELLEEAQGLIPRFAPRWTDHNAHDPGIMLLELVAWLVDQDIYQLGFVSDNHIRAFAALLGAHPSPAQAACGLVWPYDRAMSSDPAKAGVNLVQGASAETIEQPDVPFEVAEDMHISPAQLVDIVHPALRNSVNLQAQGAVWMAPVNLQLDDASAALIEIVFDRPLVEVEESCRRPNSEVFPVSLGVILNNPLIPPTTAEHTGDVLVEYRIDKTGSQWRRVSVSQDSTQAFNRSGILLLNLPPESLDDVQKKPSRLRIHTRHKTHKVMPALARLSINVIPVEQRDTRPAQAFGTSNGLPDQSLALSTKGLITQLELEVEEHEQHQLWAPVDTLSNQGPEDKVFTVDTASGHITFGNGLNGAIPPTAAQLFHRAYTVTQGAKGNLISGLRWNIPGVPLRTDSPVGTNIEDIGHGLDASDFEELRALARQRALARAVNLTNQDLVDAAMDLRWLGIERAQVLLNYVPNMGRGDVSGTRALVVVPARSQQADPFSPPAKRLLDRLRQHLDAGRVLGERLIIVSATPVPVRVKADLLITDGADINRVLDAAKAQLNARLSDIQVADSEQSPWPLGRPVTQEEIKTLLAQVPDIIAVPECGLARGEQAFQEKPIRLAADELAIGAQHTFSAHTDITSLSNTGQEVALS